MDITAQGDDLIWRASEIDTATKCMRKLGYARLGAEASTVQETVPVVPQYSWALIAGCAMDDALCGVSKAQMEGRNPRTFNAEDFYDQRLTYHHREFSAKGVVTGTTEDRELALTDGHTLLDTYIREYGDTFHPVGVQTQAAINIPWGDQQITLVGHIDLKRQAEDGHVIISDWKFGKMKYDAPSYARGWAYDLMDGDESHHIEVITLRRGLKTPVINSSSHFVTKAQHKQVVRQVRTVADMYAKRYFPMTDPGNWWCDERFCEAWTLCRGNPNGPAKIPGEI